MKPFNETCHYHGPENWCAECLHKDHMHWKKRAVELKAENAKLREAIRDHKDSFTDEECYTEEDNELWAALEGK